MSTFLQKQGLIAKYYHAGREDEQRQKIEKRWKENQYKVVCSTNALGMGIDKRDVRFIVHYQIPASPIHYYQEMGKAGRDGIIARCILLYNSEDLVIQKHFINNARPESAKYETVIASLKGNIQGINVQSIMRTTGLSQTAVRTILSDLEDQQIIEHIKNNYHYLPYASKPLFADYDIVCTHKLQELQAIQNYALTEKCFMEYLATYLGNNPDYHCRICGNCRPDLFPTIDITERIQKAVKVFEEDGREHMAH